MAMTKKDFQAIADIINGNAPMFPADLSGTEFEQGNRYGRVNALADVTDELADYFKSVNSNFDEARFRKACGLDA